MKNSIEDLNNHLFMQLERLSDNDLDLNTELERTKAVCNVASQIVDTAKVKVEAMKVMEKAGYEIKNAGNNILQLKPGNE